MKTSPPPATPPILYEGRVYLGNPEKKAAACRLGERESRRPIVGRHQYLK